MNHSYRICFPPIFFLLLNRTLREHSWFVFTMCVVGHLIKVCVEFYCVVRFLSMTWNPSTLQFHKKTKKHPNNTNTEIWHYVDDTTILEPVPKNQGNMIQDTVNEQVAESLWVRRTNLPWTKANVERCKFSFAKIYAKFASIMKLPSTRTQSRWCPVSSYLAWTFL